MSALRCRGAASIHVRFSLVLGPAILPDDERALTVQAERLTQTGRDETVGLLREAMEVVMEVVTEGGDGGGVSWCWYRCQLVMMEVDDENAIGHLGWIPRTRHAGNRGQERRQAAQRNQKKKSKKSKQGG